MIESRGLSEDINTRTWLWLDVIGGHASETKKKKGEAKTGTGGISVINKCPVVQSWVVG